MKYAANPWMTLLFSALVLWSCNKEEPFEYPEDPVDVEPTWITEAERKIRDSENWNAVQFADGCNPNVPVSNLAFYELNYTRGFATLQLIPDDTSCTLDASLKSPFKASEISIHPIEDLHFEFTFSEYNGHSGTELIVSLYYKELELELDLVPTIESLIQSDTTNGLFELSFVDDEPLFELNGKSFEPDFSVESGNIFNLKGTGDDPYVQVELTSRETDVQSYLQFKYIRISRFGIPDA